MQLQLLSQQSGIPLAELERLLGMGARQIYNDANYQAMVDGLDVTLLEETVLLAREAYSENLDPLKTHLEEKYKLGETVMSPFSLGNWLVGFLYRRENLTDLIGKHKHLPTDAIREGLPQIVDMLNDMTEGSSEWKRAMVLLSIPLMADH